MFSYHFNFSYIFSYFCSRSYISCLRSVYFISLLVLVTLFIQFVWYVFNISFSFYLMYILFKFFSITENNFNSCLLLLLVNFVIDS